jgi:hypothetical protein
MMANLSFYQWSNVNIDGKDYSVFAIAENEEKAKEIVLSKISSDRNYAIVKKYITEYKPTTHNKPDSFIIETKGQYLA